MRIETDHVLTAANLVARAEAVVARRGQAALRVREEAASLADALENNRRMMERVKRKAARRAPRAAVPRSDAEV